MNTCIHRRFDQGSGWCLDCGRQRQDGHNAWGACCQAHKRASVGPSGPAAPDITAPRRSGNGQAA